jgi:hypothetical protein
MNLWNLKRVFREGRWLGSTECGGEWSGLGRKALVFLIPQHHFSYTVRTEIEDISGRKGGIAAAASSHLNASSFPLSPFNTIPRHFSFGLHYTGYS